LKCDHLLEFLSHPYTVIEADRDAEVVKVSPAFDENEVSDLESGSYIVRTAAVPLRQIAHMPAQATSNPATITNTVRIGDTLATPLLKATRFEAIERIETP
jgi:hypothetical protein